VSARTFFDGDGDGATTSWLVFSDVWNGIVGELREVDLLSNAERDNLVFVHLDIDETIQASIVASAFHRTLLCLRAACIRSARLAHANMLTRCTARAFPQVVNGMRPFMLPVFFYGGQISRALETPSSSASPAQTVALQELRCLLVWLLLQTGVLTRSQVSAGGHEPRAPPGSPADSGGARHGTAGLPPVLRRRACLPSSGAAPASLPAPLPRLRRCWPSGR
jgi:hypothetical protein